MKIQIAIVTKKMITGGVEKALIAMLKKFDYQKIDVDLYVEKPGGDLIEGLPKEITIRLLKTVNINTAIFHPVVATQKLSTFLMLKKKRPFIKQCYFSSKMLLPVKKTYDIAISYHAPNTIPVFYVIDKMKAKKKVLWLHGDMETNEGNTSLACRYYTQYDQIFSVSESVYSSFIKYYSYMKEITSIFYNFVDIEGIIKAVSIAPTFKNATKFNILTVGRLEEQKGIDLAIKVCYMLSKSSYDVYWYVCGDGSQRSLLEQMISEYGIQNRFILLGNQNNPYGYMENCDLYVQPSRFEGYCTTTNEARILNKPVITTDVAGAREQFEDGVTGWIVPIDINAIYHKITELMQHPDCVTRIVDNLKRLEKTNMSNINILLDGE